jgi:hypothetical protein
MPCLAVVEMESAAGLLCCHECISGHNQDNDYSAAAEQQQQQHLCFQKISPVLVFCKCQQHNNLRNFFPAGLVRVLTAACPELAAALKQQQQQQQQQSTDAADDAAKESLLCTRLVAAAALQVLRRCILADRPAQVRACKHLNVIISFALCKTKPSCNAQGFTVVQNLCGTCTS